MNKISLFTLLIVLMGACKKDKAIESTPPEIHPVMQYLDLHDASVNFGGHMIIDINTDGKDDFLFSTMLVGDPVLERDRRQYYVSSGTESRLLQNTADQTPVLNKNDAVMLHHAGYDWFEVASALLAEKIIPQTGAAFWQGSWKNVVHKYLAVQVKKNAGIYNGWIELSFDTVQEKLVLHRAAICTEAGKNIKAGI